ncbi:hypothetical protein CTH30272_02687 [Allocatenococcus thiocycli]|nr:hypothetical protein CTH30272_02678 [Catenococcus thiocycli]CAH0530098.1 hypothetical protein CTH30272_02679 [Catenococcus thiocycli]CAH0530112.1 hypothetical protein CTH30272_02686 [Catenococcus thiocycli]CAH0530114.1 hypothetical protein CTH30272_02687 [Catenococcus thiocycli]
MTNKTKSVRSFNKPADYQATERIVITPIQKQFIEQQFNCRAAVYIRRMIDELMIRSAIEGVNNDD